ncbi:DUF4054 domain-containing protein [Rhodospirillum sp. A1_3_36]|uniref:DUF4054 domain-containing protein n=1 Tax=Rhodospirillum sp. A1_3_36 TaxID=3391666 RepID=UPI0039A54B4D
MTPAEFREMIPAFADATVFPDATVTRWLAFAEKRCPLERWQDLQPHGIAFLAAHHLTLIAAASKATDGTGGLDAAGGGVVSESKTVGSISTSISRGGAAATADIRGGDYNSTSWGKQYWSLAATIGAGGLVA